MIKIYISVLLCLLTGLRLPAQCNPDTEPPTVQGIDDISASITPTGLLTLWATDLLLAVQDNCTPLGQIALGVRRLGAGSGFPIDPDTGGPQLQVTFHCCETGMHPLELWARDAAGNSAADTVHVLVEDYLQVCFCYPVIGSCAFYVRGEGIDEVAWAVNAQHPALPQADLFSLGHCFGPAGFPDYTEVTVTPSKDADPLNGVSTFDALQISKYILGLRTFENPYQIISADINRSGSITTFDIVELRKLILGIYTQLPNNTSWRFIPKDYVFPDPSNPFAEAFPESLSVTMGVSSPVQADFIGIKIGDVDSNGNNLVSDQPEDRSPVYLRMEDRMLRPGETCWIPVWLSETMALSGIQGALGFDPSAVRILQVRLNERLLSPAMKNETFYAQPAPGQFTLSWSAIEAVRLAADEPIGMLEIQALQAATLGSVFWLDETRLRPELYTDTDARRRLNLGFNSEALPDQTRLYPARPNPGLGPVDIPLTLAKPEKVHLVIFTPDGRLVWRTEQTMPDGAHRLTVPAHALNKNGPVLIYRITAGTLSDTGMLVRQ